MIELSENSIAVVSPHLLNEWDYEKNEIDPRLVTKGMNKKFWWKCEQYGHSWLTEPHRRIKGAGCHYCSNQKVLAGFNDLAFRFPEIVELWHPTLNNGVLPSQVMPGTEKNYWWLGECGHEWKMSPVNIRRGKRCPYCAGHRVLKGFNDFETKFPEQSLTWDYMKNNGKLPSEVVYGSNKKVWWICEEGHSKMMSPKVRSMIQGCGICYGRVLNGVNDFATTHSNLLEQWDYVKNKDLDPKNYSMYSTESFWWICEKGHSRKTMIKTRIKSGCLLCKNGLAEKYPELRNEWDYEKNKNRGLVFDDLTARSGLRAFWKCRKGHEWEAVIHTRTGNKPTNCPYCSGMSILAGFNDLATVRPDLIKEWDYEKNNALGVDPTKFGVSSEQRVWWICQKSKHSWATVLITRTGKNGVGCPYCANREVLTGLNDLATIRPELVAQWDYEKNALEGIELDPTKIAGKSSLKVWWKCQKGHSYFLSPNAKKKLCHKCWNGFASTEERILADFVESLMGVDKVIRNDRSVIAPKELDIYVPSLNIAFEYNGIYWHDKTRYINDLDKNSFDSPEMFKTIMCEQVGIKLVHIWEDDWLEDQESIKDTIRECLTASEYESSL